MKAIGIILAGGNSSKMRELTNKRALAAMPIIGSYRSIDFTLSNMTNSHINNVAVLTQYNARSLNQHLSSSKWWNFGRKNGGLFVFTPIVTPNNTWWYRGTADSIYQNIDWISKCHEPYVVITSGDCICKLDYNDIIDYHIEKGADITVACSATDEDPSRFGVLKLDDDNRVVEFEEKPMVPTSNIVSAGVYVMRRRLLIELIEQSAEEGRYDLVNDILIRYKNLKKIYAYKIESYWSNISTVEAYFKTNMDFLKEDVRKHFFETYPKIYSKVDDVPPAKYNPGSNVSGSLISGGAIINGDVKDSVIFKNVHIGKNCKINNAVIMNDVFIGDNTVIENCIVESRGVIDSNTSYVGEAGKPKIVVSSKRLHDIESK